MSADPSRDYVAPECLPSRSLCPITTARRGRSFDVGLIVAHFRELFAAIVALPHTFPGIRRLTASSKAAESYGGHPVRQPR